MLEKVIVARSYGFCMGVKRAIQIAEETSKTATEPVTILNEIVHNEAVVERFRSEGVGQAFSLDDVKGGTLIISAHGIAPAVIENARAKGLNVVDATCPLVTVIYDIIKKVVAEGYYIVHFGDPDHDETAGVVGHAPERITVLKKIEDMWALPDWKERKLALTVQTTSSLEEFITCRQEAAKRWPHIEVFDTICNATNKRQTAIMDLAPQVDMVLVVGSQSSANSQRLTKIAKSICGKAQLIGSALDIRREWFAADQQIRSVGVSAGASTPDFLVDAVLAKLVDISGGTATVAEQEKRAKRAPKQIGQSEDSVKLS